MKHRSRIHYRVMWYYLLLYVVPVKGVSQHENVTIAFQTDSRIFKLAFELMKKSHYKDLKPITMPMKFEYAFDCLWQVFLPGIHTVFIVIKCIRSNKYTTIFLN